MHAPTYIPLHILSDSLCIVTVMLVFWYRVSRLRQDNVLWTLVSLARLCDFGSKASITQPSVAAFEGQRFVHDVLSVLTALATGALQDSSFAIWSSTVVMVSCCFRVMHLLMAVCGSICTVAYNVWTVCSAVTILISFLPPQI